MSRADPQVNFRMPQELKEKLEAAAAENRRSTTAELIARLESTFHLDHIRPANMLISSADENAQTPSGLVLLDESHRSRTSLTDLEELRLNIEIVLEQVKGMTATPRTKQLKAPEPALFDEPRPRRLRTNRKKPTE